VREEEIEEKGERGREESRLERDGRNGGRAESRKREMAEREGMKVVEKGEDKKEKLEENSV